MSYAENTSSDNAMRLVEAMELNHAALLAVQIPYLMAREQNPARPVSDDQRRFMACLKSTDAKIYAEINANGIAEQMSAEEIQQAIDFFESPAGKKLNKHGFFQLYEAFGLHAPERPPVISPLEAAEKDRFQRTSAGDKLLSKHILSSGAIREKIGRKNDEVISGCAKK